MSQANSIFGSRAQEYFQAAKQKGSWIQNADGCPNKDNIRSLRSDVSPPQGGKSNIKPGQQNAFGGKVDMTA